MLQPTRRYLTPGFRFTATSTYTWFGLFMCMSHVCVYKKSHWLPTDLACIQMSPETYRARGVPFKCNSLAAVNHILLQHQLLPLSKDTYRAKEKQTVLWKYTVWRMKDKHPLGPKGSSCEWNWCAQQAASSDAGEVFTHMLTSRLPDILVFNNLAYSFS